MKGVEGQGNPPDIAYKIYLRFVGFKAVYLSVLYTLHLSNITLRKLFYFDTNNWNLQYYVKF